MGIEEFQQDIKNGMGLEEALIKHNLTLLEAFDMAHKPITRKNKRKTYQKRNIYTTVDEYISKRGDGFHLRKRIKGKTVWGGSYSSLEDAQQVKEYLNKHGWNIVKVNQACKELGITRRRR